MARIRYLKPDFFKDEDLAEHPYWIRLLFAGLWNIADKKGRLEDRIKRIKIDVFPYDNVDIEKGLQELSKPKNGSNKPFIQRYEVEGCEYIQIVNWDKHQKPHSTEKESEIPPAPPLKGMEKGMEKGMGSVELKSPVLNNAQITVKEPLRDVIKEIVQDLNLVIGTNYKINSKATKELIMARLNEKYTLDDFKTVHRKMLRAWGTDEKMVKYLRPITLYGTKFESYLNQKTLTTKLTPEGIKAYLIGREWLNKEQGGQSA